MMRLLYRHRFKAQMCSTVFYIATILTLLIGSTLQSTTEKIEMIGEEVQAEVKELKQDLEHAESKDPQKLEIYKQIRRLNPDGSYTVGYESDDGSFKIESRDVQGNVKGTYGYVDANGEIKRVSYIASNSTGNKKPNDETQASTNPKPNRTQYVTSTTKRPYSSQSTTNSPNRQSVIQTIPRKRLLSQFSLDKLSQSSTATTPIAQQSNSFYITSKYPEISPVTDSTTTVIYATSVPTAKPTIVVHPTQLTSGSGRNLDQITRPDRQDSDSSNRNVQIVNARESSSTSKPVVEIDSSKEIEKVTIRGSNYRRQLPNDKLFDRESEATTATQQQIIYSHVDDDEGSSVYGGSTPSKPLYTSTSTSRIPAIVIAARQRANQIQQAINNGQTTIAPNARSSEKNYVKPKRNQDINKSSVEQSTESTSEQNFLTQTSHPIVQIPPNRGGQQPENDEPVIYRRRPIPPQNFQQYPIREHIRGVNPNGIRNIGREPPTNINDRSEQFTRETGIPPSSEGLETGPQHFPDENLIIPPNIPPFRGQRKPYDPRQQFVSQQEQDSEYDQQYFPNPGYNRFNPNYGNDILNKPLTALDFERLLHYLVLRHQQIQQLSARFGYYPQANIYNNRQNFGQYSPYQQIPRPPIIDPGFYDPRNPYYRPSNQVRQYNEPESAYQAQNPIPEQAGGQYRRKPSNYYPTQYFTDTTGSYTKNDEQYDEAQPNNDENDLPSNIREELLYRMLMLAIRGESPNVLSNAPNKDINPISISGARGQYTKKPVRSVQILSED